MRVYPEMTLEDYNAGINLIWLFLRAFEWSSVHSEINKEKPDIESAEKNNK